MTDPNTRVTVGGNVLTVGAYLASHLENINAYLQMVALIVAIVSGIMTFIYHYNKNKKS